MRTSPKGEVLVTAALHAVANSERTYSEEKTMTIPWFARVILTQDIQDQELVADDMGTIVEHHPATKKHPGVCSFVLALFEHLVDHKVDQQECMAKGGNVCRFAFKIS